MVNTGTPPDPAALAFFSGATGDVMDIDFEELLRVEMEEFDWTLDQIGIPKELFKECWQSIGEMELLNDQWGELRKEDETLTDESPAFLELKTIPNIRLHRPSLHGGGAQAVAAGVCVSGARI